MKRSKGIALFVLILLILIVSSLGAGFIIKKTGEGSTKSIKLGLDLAGGVSITYQTVKDNPTDEEMSDTIYKLQRRVESYSTEAQVYKEGSNRINIEIPGVNDANAILTELGKPGSLNFQDGDGNVVLTGTDIADAQAGSSSHQVTGSQEYVVELTLTPEGTAKFAKATADNVGKRIAIVFDGQTISNPNVNEAITGGQAQITGMANYKEAELLASQIRIGSLSLELEELHSKVVGAQLGSEALATSLKAAAVGLVLILLFMLVVYLIPGLAANIALLLYCGLLIGVLWIFDITLTLPGIAGIVLSIGMAVDANVLIFARLREELAAGRSVEMAMKVGFQKAFSAIFDGNLTTLIAAVVLGLRGSGPVKGFAYTLGIGVVLSMFTALVVTRWILRCFLAMGITDPKFYGQQKQRKPFDFIGKRVPCFVISIALVVAGVVGMGIHEYKLGTPLNYSLDFVGGNATTVTFNQDYTIEEINKEIVPVVSQLTGDGNVQTQKIDGTNEVVIKTRSLNLEEREALSNGLVESFGVDKAQILSENISSTVSNEMKSDAIWAVVIASICMLIYIWFRFKDIRFASAAIIELLNDLLIVLAFYAICRVTVGNTFIACMLTIMGYSLNSTVVIFDRIRENMVGVKEQTPEVLKEVANHSITQSLSRCINTSLTLLIMVFVLWLFGVASIREFAAPLIVGVLAGAYSDIFVTSSLWYVFKTRFGKKAKLARKRKS
ncbi:protein translocase subunit SecDF [Clostridia bacterium]|nr:protein translocase subunit SecDF [Clostridia bacterium]